GECHRPPPAAWAPRWVALLERRLARPLAPSSAVRPARRSAWGLPEPRLARLASAQHMPEAGRQRRQESSVAEAGDAQTYGPVLRQQKALPPVRPIRNSPLLQTPRQSKVTLNLVSRSAVSTSSRACEGSRWQSRFLAALGMTYAHHGR